MLGRKPRSVTRLILWAIAIAGVPLVPVLLLIALDQEAAAERPRLLAFAWGEPKGTFYFLNQNVPLFTSTVGSAISRQGEGEGLWRLHVLSSTALLL